MLDDKQSDDMTSSCNGEDDRDNFPETSADKERFFTNGYERTLLPTVGHSLPREAPDAVVYAALRLAEQSCFKPNHVEPQESFS
jgi:hypothetical protein